MRGRLRTGIFAAIGLLLLILDSKTALAGAQEAMELCLTVVIPSLFPFFVLSGMLAGAVSGGGYKILRPMERLLGIPFGAGGLFLTGLLGGYPTGAQAVAEAWKRGQLSRDEGKRMLAFCSNAGPAFLFGILGRSFSNIGLVWLLWGIHILSPIIVGAILPGRVNHSRRIPPSDPPSLPKAVRRAVTTTAYVCGWIVLFRVILAFLTRWCLWLVGENGQVAIFGILELTNGCCSLHLIDNEGLRLMIASGILAFGGLCVAMQTASVTGELGSGWYLPGKILQTAISLVSSGISALLLYGVAMLPSVFAVVIFGVPLSIAVLWLIRRKNEKTVAFSRWLVYNRGITIEGGKIMLFRKRIEKACSYCQYATALDGEQMLCIKRGVVLANGKCRKFTYDPIKRIPPKPKALDFDKYSQEDYSL